MKPEDQKNQDKLENKQRTTFASKSNKPEGLVKSVESIESTLRDETTDTVCEAACKTVEFALRRKSEEAEKDYQVEQINLRSLEATKSSLSNQSEQRSLQIQADRLTGLNEIKQLLSDYEHETQVIIDKENEGRKNQINDIEKKQCSIAAKMDILKEQITNPSLGCDSLKNCDKSVIQKHLK